ncbi:hypothetical protein [Streptomyces sp. NPDC047070]|uniref:hypothetical protein n=1 Tax=Streptomyces sp. NPDC047070 TaxID=3154923 RepID=UPI003454DFC3
MTETPQAPPTVTVSLKTITVSVLPETHPDFDSYVLTLERDQGTELWKIRHGGRALDVDGVWTHDGPCRCRIIHRPTWHSYEAAMTLAVEAAPNVEFNGRTAAAVWQSETPPTSGSEAPA